MPPAKRKVDQAEVAVPPPPPRVTRAAAKRSAAATSEPRPAPEEKKAKKAKGANKKKEKKEIEVDAVQSENIVEKGDAADNVLDASNKTIVVEHWCVSFSLKSKIKYSLVCGFDTQCKSFKTRANLVKEGLEKAGCGISVILNPGKGHFNENDCRVLGCKLCVIVAEWLLPTTGAAIVIVEILNLDAVTAIVVPRRGCFEIRQQEGKKFISLLDMNRPFKLMKDLDMDKEAQICVHFLILCGLSLAMCGRLLARSKDLIAKCGPLLACSISEEALTVELEFICCGWRPRQCN
ncbi:hypothetical protein CR513_20968, partial [Mucuna pruriens]